MNANRQFMDHRWGTRVDLDLLVHVRLPDGGISTGFVRNASISGAMLETDDRPALLSRVAIRPPGSTGRWLDACVVRLADDGLALEWLEPGVDPLSVLLLATRESATTGALRDTSVLTLQPGASH